MVLLSCCGPSWPVAYSLATLTACCIEANGALTVPGLASLPPLTLTYSVTDGVQRSSNGSRSKVTPRRRGNDCCERGRRQRFSQPLMDNYLDEADRRRRNVTRGVGWDGDE